jgi:hypothetical protein
LHRLNKPRTPSIATGCVSHTRTDFIAISLIVGITLALCISAQPDYSFSARGPGISQQITGDRMGTIRLGSNTANVGDQNSQTEHRQQSARY